MSHDHVDQAIVEVAKTKILPRFRKLKEDEISAKSPGDMVSIADTEAEDYLTELLQQLYPNAVIAGEESIAHQPDLVQKIIEAEQAFLIDPVDGTNNFIKGDERFALMVVELHKAQTVAAWIYLPVSGTMARAEKGAGAYLNNVKTQVPQKSLAIGDMVGAAHINRFPDDLKQSARNNIKAFKENSPAFCAGYDYIALLRGEKNFSLYYRTLPWDHLPGGLIFAEAGGFIRTLQDESSYSIYDHDKGLLSARNEQDWRAIKAILFPDGMNP